MKRLLFIIAIFILTLPYLKADDGMWIPILLQKYNIADMQKKGFKLTAEDIYSINKASLKDAVCLFGGGCTAELVSGEGLLLTNHHCGYDAIQRHSTLDHNYLSDGFWAATHADELPNEGLSVSFLVSMEDVTDQVLANVKDGMPESQRQKIVSEAIANIEKVARLQTKNEVKVKPMFSGNEYYLFINEIFRDIRLVGAPPSSIGKFGGDTDNWVWPRHTGDFSVFRIYANKNNEPATYSLDNVPYKPKKFLSVSLKGIKEGDFTMVYGFPGRTSEYLPASAVEMIQNYEDPSRIKLRQIRLDNIKLSMDTSISVRIKYASKQAGIANGWKKWIGEVKGLKKINAIDKKHSFENGFTTWANDPSRAGKYSKILSRYQEIYKEIIPYDVARIYVNEAVFSIEIMDIVGEFESLALVDKKTTKENIDKHILKIKNRISNFYKNYYQPIDKLNFAQLLKAYHDDLDAKFYPEVFKRIDKKFKGDFAKYADFVFEKSIITDRQKIEKFLAKFTYKDVKTLLDDPAYKLYSDVINLYRVNILPNYSKYDDELTVLHRTYMQGQREFLKDKIFYADANLTLRVAYGKVEGYCPYDGVCYNYFTTLKGIMQKDNPDIYDYDVPKKLKDLFAAKDFGIYSTDSTMHVGFIASNHTTGGNSGSPVLDANGNLIGINFDRCWEGTMSDIMYDPDQCHNISLDIRYALFIIDKFAGAKHLVDEMNIVK